MIPERHAPALYALFRIVVGFLFLCVGLQKMFGLFGGQQAELFSLQGAAGVVETFGGLLVMLGLFTKPAAFIASGEMAVAFWYIHVILNVAGAEGVMRLVPIMNGGERATFYCFAFLYIAARGPGMCSLDSAITSRK
jgi:putative oxidoreductase